MDKNILKKISDQIWEIPKGFRPDMKVSARIYASEEMIPQILRDRSLEQLVNVSTLPGITGSALAMPDAHEGYGFPIGGVAAFDAEEGVISPGGVGYDINCGVRLLRSNIFHKDIKERLDEISGAIFSSVPSGVGKGGGIHLKGKEMDKVLKKGAAKIVEMGYGTRQDLENTESGGSLDGADEEKVSSEAKQRGFDQAGTLGSGNHFIEVEKVEEIFDEKEAARLGLFIGQVVIMIHTGSRGLGHQVATDHIKTMVKSLPKFGLELADRELACAPFRSNEGQGYFGAMASAANFAWANRQMITSLLRDAWKRAVSSKAELYTVYDVAHNIAKLEEHDTPKGKKKVVVHRKGATRAFPGQPVLIPGSMGTGSYLLIGQEASMKETFGSTCHGAGRLLSRTQAKKEIRGFELKEKLNKIGIEVKTASLSGLAEEAPSAYKNVDEVVNVVDGAGIARKVARFSTMAVIKG